MPTKAELLEAQARLRTEKARIDAELARIRALLAPIEDAEIAERKALRAQGIDPNDNKLSSRMERRSCVLRMRDEGKTFKAIGDELGISTVRARTIYETAKRMDALRVANGRPSIRTP